jgi:uncharacterized tellurite resistance protein B-like protein
MIGKQSIYYALGILAYAVAKSDGEIQFEEREKLAEIIERELEHNLDFQYAEIIFELLEKENRQYENVYNWALEELKKGRHFLSPEIKTQLVGVLKDIARAFGSMTIEESNIIDRFEKDLESIGSDHYFK